MDRITRESRRKRIRDEYEYRFHSSLNTDDLIKTFLKKLSENSRQLSTDRKLFEVIEKIVLEKTNNPSIDFADREVLIQVLRSRYISKPLSPSIIGAIEEFKEKKQDGPTIEMANSGAKNQYIPSFFTMALVSSVILLSVTFGLNLYISSKTKILNNKIESVDRKFNENLLGISFTTALLDIKCSSFCSIDSNRYCFAQYDPLQYDPYFRYIYRNHLFSNSAIDSIMINYCVNKLTIENYPDLCSHCYDRHNRRFDILLDSLLLSKNIDRSIVYQIVTHSEE